MTSDNNPFPAAPTVSPSSHKAQLRQRLLAAHAGGETRRGFAPRWLRVAAMVGCALMLFGAGAAAKAAYDEYRTTIYTFGTRPPAVVQDKGNVETLVSGGGVAITSAAGPQEASQRFDLMKRAVAEKRYRFVKEQPDAATGQQQYIYALQLAEGKESTLTFTVRLEDVRDWDDLQAKQQELARARVAAVADGIQNHRASIVGDDVVLYYVCREEDGKEVQVMRQKLPNGTELACVFPSPLGAAGPVQRTPWQEHLNAIASGKRRFLRINATALFVYEVALADGSKVRSKMGVGVAAPK